MYQANLLNCLFCGWFVAVGTRAQISILWQTIAKLNRFVVEIAHFPIECCRVDHNRCASENLIRLRPHLSSCFLAVYPTVFLDVYVLGCIKTVALFICLYAICWYRGPGTFPVNMCNVMFSLCWSAPRPVLQLAKADV